jgi:hypothetical protein
MDKKLLDIYTDYLISQNNQATATGLSALLDGELSHDKLTRFLNHGNYGSKELWEIVKPILRKHENNDGALILDDSIVEKPHSKENDIVSWHYSHAKGTHLKGINFLSCMARYNDMCLPVSYEIVHKDCKYFDDKEERWRRRASITKNEHFIELLKCCKRNGIKYKYVLADNWFAAKNNLEFINFKQKKKFIIGIKSNRTVAVSYSHKKQGLFQKVSSLKLSKNSSLKVYLKGIEFPMKLLKKVFKNENGSEGILYLITNDMDIDEDRMYEIYQKRWRIEEYHKSTKNNASLAKSPTKIVKSQRNHIFSSIVAYVKLEKMRLSSAVNHFALKYKLLIKANQSAFKELQNLKNLYATA